MSSSWLIRSPESYRAAVTPPPSVAIPRASGSTVSMPGATSAIRLSRPSQAGSQELRPSAARAASDDTSATMLLLMSTLAAAHGANPMSGPAHTPARQGAAPDAARTPYPAPVARQRPVGTITRGTTNPNRLRRVDRWLAGPQAWRLRRAAGMPVVVDLGYGASPVTAVELHDRLRRVRPDVEVVGIEIDPARVAAARPLERPGLRFRLGGFEVPLDGGARPTVVRAFNVLRQYDEAEVAGAWAHGPATGWPPDGLLVDGTCDELGRRSAWVAVGRTGPLSLSLSWRLRGLERPSDIAERLPKSLIHRNVEGEPVHA